MRASSAAEFPVQTFSYSDSAEPAGALTRIAVLIPAWQPGDALVPLAAKLLESGVGALLIVDDGSASACSSLFSMLGRMPRTTVLRHERNRGKGSALKTGFRYLMPHESKYTGIVTADADGQHTAEDIVRVARALLVSGGRAVLGVRRFEGEVPWRSRFGNRSIRWLFSRLAGKDVTDTQTGLRGLPAALLPELLSLVGERYEYEMTMLAHLCRPRLRMQAAPIQHLPIQAPPMQGSSIQDSSILEVPIKTVYLEGNRGSHFHPLWDSARVFVTLARLALRRG